MGGVIRDDWLLVVLTILAVTRLTRLVTVDVVFQPFRSFVIRHRPAPPSEPASDLPAQDKPPKEDWLVYLIHCRWCASMWITFPVVAVVYNWPRSWAVQIVLVGLAASLVAALAAGLER